MEKDSIITGLVVGALTPVLGFMALEQILQTLMSLGWLDIASGESVNSRQRTVALMALCCNLIPFHYFYKNYCDYSMRGIVFPTMIYVGAWLHKYALVLF